MDFFWPDHKYVPGRTKRHSEGLFDPTRDTATTGMSVSALQDCQAFQTGLIYLKHGYYWEAHEVLEPVWMALDQDKPERQFVQGLIQLANGLLKIEMDKPNAALRLSVIALDLFDTDACHVMGVSVQKMRQQVMQLNAAANAAL